MVEPLPPGHLLVVRPRRPDPTTPARAFPPSRARRSRGRSSISPVMGAVVLVAAALLLVAQSAVATQASYQINTLKDQQTRLLAEQQQLRSQLALVQSPSHVAAMAQSMGLGQPARWQYLTGASSPIALAPRQPVESRGLLGGVLAVVGTLVGRPGESQAAAP